MNRMKKFNILSALLFLSLLSASIIYTSCSKDDDKNSSEIVLQSWGPSPALRGGEMKFIGNNLDQVTEVILPNSISVTTFKIKTPELLVIDVPEGTMPGMIVLKTPQGDITPLTELGISEPIKLDTIVPANARPGETVTIKGDYLNLISQVIFTANKVVEASAFVTHSKTEIQVVIPEDARPGIVSISNGAEEPIIVESSFVYGVAEPKVTSLSPLTVKAGTNLTITGTNLDLTKQIIFGGAKSVTNFESISATQIVVKVPADAQDGIISLYPASKAEVISAEALTMVVPTITSFPNIGKNKANITVSGTDLDLVTSVTFGGDKTGTIVNKTADQIEVTIPANATEGIVTFKTDANKSVSSATTLTLVKPTITSIVPLTTAAYQNITVNGTDLDIVSKVNFTSPEGSNYFANVTGATASQFTVTVTPGAISGKITLVTTNGTTVESSDAITVIANVPVISSWPTEGFLTTKMTLTGTNMDLASEIIFPGNIKATMFAVKTPTSLEVFVPANTTKGLGKIRIITINNEIVTSSDINFKALGAEPVVDQTLVFFNFDGLDSWWTNVGGVIENDPTLSVDGTKYFRVNTASGGTGWKAIFARNSGNNFPGAKVGTDVANYSLKFDVNIIDPISDPVGVVAIRLQGDEGDYFYNWAPWKNASYKTTGWITVTIPLTDFKDNYGGGVNSPIDLSKITKEFGFIWNNSTTGPALNMCFDNARLQKNN
jgi:hypothetical protein